MAISLRAARINAGYTQIIAAKELGISECTLSNYERGKSFPDVPIISRMEELYGVSYSDIIFLPNDYGEIVNSDKMRA